MQRQSNADPLSPQSSVLHRRFHRLFIALETNEAVQRAVGDVQQTLRRRGGSLQGSMAVRWVRPTQVHVTLQFLGTVMSAHIPSVIAAVAPAVARHSTFFLRTDAVGAFPSVETPRVLWLGLRGGDDALLSLQRSVADAVRMVEGVVADRKPFQPHLTLGRVERVHRDAPGLTAVAEALRRPVLVAAAPWPVESVALIRSILGAGGSRYTVIERFPLRRGEQAR